MITSFTAIKSWKILISRDPNIHDSYTKFGVHFLLASMSKPKDSGWVEVKRHLSYTGTFTLKSEAS